MTECKVCRERAHRLWVEGPEPISNHPHYTHVKVNFFFYGVLATLLVGFVIKVLS
jgi:hypothetical protein